MSWSAVKMGEFLINRDCRFKPKDPQINGLKRIEKIDFSGNIYISEKPSNTDMILVKKGDLVISGINVEKGAMAVYQGEEDIIATIHYSSYEFDKTKIDLDYLKNFLRSKKFTDALKEQVPGGIKTEIKPKHILPLRVEMPADTEEQRRIIKDFEFQKNKVESIDIENTHQLDFLRKLRQQILLDAVQGKLVPQNPTDEPASKLLERIKAEKEKLVQEKKIKKEELLPSISPKEIPFEIPENWMWCRGNEIAVFIDPQPSHRTPPEVINGIPYISMKDISDKGEINFNSARKVSPAILVEHSARYSLREGDFIFGKIGTIGKPVWLITPFNYTLSANLILIQGNREIVNVRFLFYFLSSPMAERYLYENKSEMSYPVFGMKKARFMPVPIPPLEEQHRIVLKINQLMTLCDELEQSIQQNQKYTQELLQVALKEALEPKTN